VIDVAVDDAVGPPRTNGELTFDEPWHARAFGICVAVLEREGLGWDAFRIHLVAAIDDDPDRPYYDSFGLALDAFLRQLRLASGHEPAT
jgi:hypothetical protein